MFRKILVPEIWAKMFSANQIAGFFHQPYLQNSSMKKPDFLHVDTNSNKLKVDQNIFWVAIVRNVFGQSGHWTLKLALSQEWIDGINWFFACRYKFRKARSYFKDFWVGLVKNGPGHLVHETHLLSEFNDWADFLHADYDRTFYFWLLNASLLQLHLLDSRQ